MTFNNIPCSRKVPWDRFLKYFQKLKLKLKVNKKFYDDNVNSN